MLYCGKTKLKIILILCKISENLKIFFSNLFTNQAKRRNNR